MFNSDTLVVIGSGTIENSNFNAWTKIDNLCYRNESFLKFYMIILDWVNEILAVPRNGLET